MWTFENPMPPPEMSSNEESIHWSRILIRSGFLFTCPSENVYDLSIDNERNKIFFEKLLSDLNLQEKYIKDRFYPSKHDVKESVWLAAFYDYQRAHTEGAPGGSAFKVEIEFLDPFISGLARSLNLMDFHTSSSCDGHGLENTYISFRGSCDFRRISNMLAAESGDEWELGPYSNTVSSADYCIKGRCKLDRRLALLSLAEKLRTMTQYAG
jgi:hypothetical protein